MNLKYFLIFLFLTLVSCDEPWETKDFELGYNDGYGAGVWNTCKDFYYNLPSQLYNRYKPSSCKSYY